MLEVIPYALIAAMGVKIWRLTMSLQELKDLSDKQVTSALAKIDDLNAQLTASKAKEADPALIDAIALNLNKLPTPTV